VVDQHSTEAVLFQPPVGEVFGQPTRGSLRCEIPVGGRADDGDTELGFDGVQRAADGVGVNPKRIVHALEAAFDVLQRRFD